MVGAVIYIDGLILPGVALCRPPSIIGVTYSRRAHAQLRMVGCLDLIFLPGAAFCRPPSINQPASKLAPKHQAACSLTTSAEHDI